MTTPSDDTTVRDQLRAALAALGRESSDETVERLLPAYQGMRSGADRLRALNLGAAEPSIIFRVPQPAGE